MWLHRFRSNINLCMILVSLLVLNTYVFAFLLLWDLYLYYFFPEIPISFALIVSKIANRLSFYYKYFLLINSELR